LKNSISVTIWQNNFLLTFVPTPIGNLEDVSTRSLKAIEKAEIILCEDTRVTKKLLHLLKEKYQFTTNFIDCIALHSHNEEQFISTLNTNYFDKNIIYMSDAGMPAVSDPGAKLVEYALSNNIKYDVLPGANALLTAYASSGFLDTPFLFFGFLPHKGTNRSSALEKVLYSTYNTILYESPHRLLKLLESLAQKVPNRDIFLAKELTKKYQTFFKAKASVLYEQLKDQVIKGEWVVIIKGVKENFNCLSVDDILEANLPKKTTAKLISKITGQKIKDIYQELLE